jgi:hypothetical protein
MRHIDEVTFRKLKEGRTMRTTAVNSRQQADLEDLARGWGKIFAAEGFGPQGPDLTVDFAQIEEFAGLGVHALVQGIVREVVWKQALALGDSQPCPSCGADCRVNWRERPMQTRYGEVQLPEPVCHCPRCRRDFFPSAAGAEAGQSRMQSGGVD